MTPASRGAGRIPAAARLAAARGGLSVAEYLDCEIWRARPQAIGTTIKLLRVGVKLGGCPLSAWSEDPEGIAFAADLAEIQRVIGEARNVTLSEEEVPVPRCY
jgi:hypothetical protein